MEKGEGDKDKESLNYAGIPRRLHGFEIFWCWLIFGLIPLVLLIIFNSVYLTVKSFPPEFGVFDGVNIFLAVLYLVYIIHALYRTDLIFPLTNIKDVEMILDDLATARPVLMQIVTMYKELKFVKDSVVEDPERVQQESESGEKDVMIVGKVVREKIYQKFEDATTEKQISALTKRLKKRPGSIVGSSRFNTELSDNHVEDKPYIRVFFKTIFTLDGEETLKNFQKQKDAVMAETKDKAEICRYEEEYFVSHFRGNSTGFIFRKESAHKRSANNSFIFKVIYTIMIFVGLNFPYRLYLEKMIENDEWVNKKILSAGTYKGELRKKFNL